jgi:hypothetical protein
MPGHRQSWLRRQAIQIAAQLPESPEEALVVLGLAREIVDRFLMPDQVVPVPRSEGASVTALRAVLSSS